MYGDKWVEKSKAFHITAKKIAEMKKGDSVKVISLDRNFCDFLGNLKLKENTNYDPKEILPKAYYNGIYFQENKLKGKFQYTNLFWKGKLEDPFNFEFDVEYADGEWYPLEKEKLSKHIVGGKKDKTSEEFIKEDVRVGWRGPMIFEKDLDKLPPLFL